MPMPNTASRRDGSASDKVINCRPCPTSPSVFGFGVGDMRAHEVASGKSHDANGQYEASRRIRILASGCKRHFGVILPAAVRAQLVIAVFGLLVRLGICLSFSTQVKELAIVSLPESFTPTEFSSSKP